METALKIANKIRAHERFVAYIIIPMWPDVVPTPSATQKIIFWQGLITKERGCIDSAGASFAKDIGQLQSLGFHEGSNFLEVVKKIKPYVLLGLSGVEGVSNDHVLRVMRDSDSTKLAIFAITIPL